MRALLVLTLSGIVTLAPAAASEPKEDKVVCKRVQDTRTGSNFRYSNKVCMKASEWKAMEDEAERAMRKVKDSGAINPDRDPAMGSSPQ